MLKDTQSRGELRQAKAKPSLSASFVKTWACSTSPLGTRGTSKKWFRQMGCLRCCCCSVSCECHYWVSQEKLGHVLGGGKMPSASKASYWQAPWLGLPCCSFSQWRYQHTVASGTCWMSPYDGMNFDAKGWNRGGSPPLPPAGGQDNLPLPHHLWAPTAFYPTQVIGSVQAINTSNSAPSRTLARKKHQILSPALDFWQPPCDPHLTEVKPFAVEGHARGIQRRI